MTRTMLISTLNTRATLTQSHARGGILGDGAAAV
jgi:hypothetical protein